MNSAGGREHRDRVAVRLEQSSHGVAKGLVVIDDGNQGRLAQISLRVRSRNNLPDGRPSTALLPRILPKRGWISKPWFR